MIEALTLELYPSEAVESSRRVEVPDRGQDMIEMSFVEGADF